MLRRLFGKRGQEAEPAPSATVVKAPEAPVEPADAIASTPAPAEFAADVKPVAPGSALTALPEAGPAIPLKALSTYRRDPAYQNFMDKTKRPPGAPARRSRSQDSVRPPDPPR